MYGWAYDLPLYRPGLNVKEGMYVKSIDGNKLTKST